MDWEKLKKEATEKLVTEQQIALIGLHRMVEEMCIYKEEYGVLSHTRLPLSEQFIDHLWKVEKNVPISLPYTYTIFAYQIEKNDTVTVAIFKKWSEPTFFKISLHQTEHTWRRKKYEVSVGSPPTVIYF